MASTAAIMSALLPGLGQLYQHHMARALAYFILFGATLALSPARWLLILIAVLSGLDAKRLAHCDASNLPRTVIFSTAAILGFLSWFMLVLVD